MDDMKNTPAGTDGHLSVLQLEMILSGDSDAAADPAIKQHLDRCPQCAAYLADAPGAADAFGRQYDSFEQLHRRYGTRQVPDRSSSIFGRIRDLFTLPQLRIGIAMAILMLVTVLGGRYIFRQNRPVVDIAYKGAAAFTLYVNSRPAAAATVRCAPGDTLQLGITAPAPVYYYIFYRDDGAELHRYLPAPGTAPQPTGSPRGEPLAHSIILDDGWTREELICLWSPAVLDAAAARTAAGRDGADNPRITVFTLVNRER